MTLSQMTKASSWSWVTKTVVIPIRFRSTLSSPRTRSRSFWSRLLSGSSSRMTLGSYEMLLASATLCCCPPLSCDG